jgi:threonine dehydrogenase-like Zn-dependent dehydrogenase
VIGTPNDEALRLTKAGEVGFDSINIGNTDPVEYVVDLTHGIGADIVVEACGAATRC